MSSNSTRAFLNPAVFTFARLWAMLSILACCAFMPLAAVYKARITVFVLSLWSGYSRTLRLTDYVLRPAQQFRNGSSVELVLHRADTALHRFEAARDLGQPRHQVDHRRVGTLQRPGNH